MARISKDEHRKRMDARRLRQHARVATPPRAKVPAAKPPVLINPLLAGLLGQIGLTAPTPQTSQTMDFLEYLAKRAA